MLGNAMWCKKNLDICENETNWTTGPISVALGVPVWHRLMQEWITVSSIKPTKAHTIIIGQRCSTVVSL